MVTNLKIIRMSNGWSQEETATKLGFSRPWYSLLESGRLIPSEDMKQKVVDVFDKPIEFLLAKPDMKKIMNKR